MIILGIDPGTIRIGYGFIEKKGGNLTCLEKGLLKISKTSHPERLVALEKNLNLLLEKIKPDKIGLEKLFFVKNQKTALYVAEARGVMLKLFTQKSIPVAEVSPKEVKLAVTGDGKAKKESVARMVNYFLNLNSEKMVDDVSDALAVALAVSTR